VEMMNGTIVRNAHVGFIHMLMGKLPPMKSSLARKRRGSSPSAILTLGILCAVMRARIPNDGRMPPFRVKV